MPEIGAVPTEIATEISENVENEEEIDENEFVPDYQSLYPTEFLADFGGTERNFNSSGTDFGFYYFF